MNFKVLLVYCNTMMDNLIPVGISSIAASLRKAGIQVELFDTTFYRTREFSGDEMRVKNYQIPPFKYSDFGVRYKTNAVCDDFQGTVNAFNPDLIALSVVEPTYELSLKLLKCADKYKIPTVMGGIHAIFDYENIIQNTLVDMVCLGEAESSFPQLCHKMADGKDYWNTPGFWIKKGGRLFKNEISRLEDLDSLPFLDASIYEKERFCRPMAGKIYKMMPVEFSRGCPFSCAYCADTKLALRFKENGSWLRFKSIDRIIAEVKFYINNYQINYFYFVSETFLAMPENRFNEFIEKYSEIKVPFWFNTRPETISEDKIKKVISAGCHRISMGIEHGNEEFRRKMLNRNVSNNSIKRAIEILNSSGLSYSVNNIIGFPDETRALVFDTIELNRSVKSNSIGCYIFSPYRGTRLRDYCKEKGYIDAEVLVPDLNFESILNMSTISKQEIAGLARTFSLYAKFSKERWPEIQSAEDDTPMGRQKFAELGKEFAEQFLK